MSRMLERLATLVTFAFVVPGALAAQRRDPALEGVWRYVAEVDRHADGSLLTTAPAAGYDGLLIFTSNGYMSSTLTPKGRTWRRETSLLSSTRVLYMIKSANVPSPLRPCPQTMHRGAVQCPGHSEERQTRNARRPGFGHLHA